TTPTQKQRVEALTLGRVSAVKYKGKLFYVYPTAQKDHIYYGKQAQYNAYKQLLQNQQGQQQMAGYATFTTETAGPNHIEVQEVDGFGPMGDTAWDHERIAIRSQWPERCVAWPQRSAIVSELSHFAMVKTWLPGA